MGVEFSKRLFYVRLPITYSPGRQSQINTFLTNPTWTSYTVYDNQHTNDFVEGTGHFFRQVPYVRCDTSSDVLDGQ
jgi:hypothetical protein